MVNLESLSARVKSLLGDNLVSMMVFGSYARGDHNEESDVDLIVVVKNKSKMVVERLAELEREIALKARNWVDLQTSKFLNLIGFKKNIFLFDESEFASKRFNFCDSRFLSWLLIPKGIIWRAIHEEGQVVVGEDLLDFEPRVSFWDKFKAPLPGIGACVIASLMLLFARDKAVQLAQTGLRWTYMNVMGVLRRSNISSVFGNFKEVLRLAVKAFSINS